MYLLHTATYCYVSATHSYILVTCCYVPVIKMISSCVRGEDRGTLPTPEPQSNPESSPSAQTQEWPGPPSDESRGIQVAPSEHGDDKHSSTWETNEVSIKIRWLKYKVTSLRSTDMLRHYTMPLRGCAMPSHDIVTLTRYQNDGTRRTWLFFFRAASCEKSRSYRCDYCCI